MSIKHIGERDWKTDYQDIQSSTTQAYIGMMLVQLTPFLPDDITRKIIDVLNSAHMRGYLLCQWDNNSIDIDPRPKCELKNDIYQCYFDSEKWKWILTDHRNPYSSNRDLQRWDISSTWYLPKFHHDLTRWRVNTVEEIFHDNFIQREHNRVLRKRKEGKEKKKCQNSLVGSQQKELKKPLKQKNKHSQKPQNVNRR